MYSKTLHCGCTITPFGVLQLDTCLADHDEDIEDEFYEFGCEWFNAPG